MKKILFYMVIGTLFLNFYCKSFGGVSETPIDNEKIRGYTQFSIWQNAEMSLLGYLAPEEQGASPRTHVWTGKVRAMPTTQTYKIAYSKKSFSSLKVNFSKIANVDATFDKLKSVTFEIVNPSEHVLEEPVKLKDVYFKDDPKIKSSKYIASLLKADSLLITMETADGANVQTQADLKKYNLDFGVQVKIDNQGRLAFDAKNLYVGYKLVDPPTNPNSYKVD